MHHLITSTKGPKYDQKSLWSIRLYGQSGIDRLNVDRKLFLGGSSTPAYILLHIKHLFHSIKKYSRSTEQDKCYLGRINLPV